MISLLEGYLPGLFSLHGYFPLIYSLGLLLLFSFLLRRPRIGDKSLQRLLPIARDLDVISGKPYRFVHTPI